MTGWVVRGVGMALVHFVARLLLALAVAQWPTHGSAFRTITLVVVILVALIWGGIDGINDRRAHADSDDRADLTMLWLKASVVAGLLAGVVAWVFTAVSSIAVSSNSFFFEITSGAAFTVLLVFIPTMVAVAVGRWLAGRDAAKDGEQSRDTRDRNRDLVSSGAVAAGGTVTGAAVGGAHADDRWRGESTTADADDYYGSASDTDTTYADTSYDSEPDTEVFEPVQLDKNDTPTDRSSGDSGWQEPERR